MRSVFSACAEELIGSQLSLLYRAESWQKNKRTRTKKISYRLAQKIRPESWPMTAVSREAEITNISKNTAYYLVMKQSQMVTRSSSTTTTTTTTAAVARMLLGSRLFAFISDLWPKRYWPETSWFSIKSVRTDGRTDGRNKSPTPMCNDVYDSWWRWRRRRRRCFISASALRLFVRFVTLIIASKDISS